VRFSVGYQALTDGRTFAGMLAPHRPAVAEVYFAWPEEPSGRTPLHDADRARLLADLADLRRMGLQLNLLFNAACYGADAASRRLEERVGAVLAAVAAAVGPPESVTTLSPAVAFVVRRAFPSVRVRASVNLRLGSVAALRQSADLFDGFCVWRDANRDLVLLKALRAWADANGKTMSLLANSGCLRACPGQAFHDNLVAHEAEVRGRPAIEGFTPFACWRYLADPAHHQAVLQATWIRPEDLGRYAGLVETVKLATRAHPRPGQVLRAYGEGRFDGNLLDLLEPGHGHLLGGRILDNRRFPEDWAEHAAVCAADGDCARCGEILERVLVPPS
jgi:collagenase-like PrtC family protease